MSVTHPLGAASHGLVAVCALVASPLVAAAGGGNGPATAVHIERLPFLDTGDTTDNSDGFDVTCPYSGSTSPDEWYSFTPAEDIWLAVSTCESAYDTKVYVLDANLEAVACNDDACSSSAGGQFRSLIEAVPLEAGHSYFIVVDGWSGDAGAFELVVDHASSPPSDCVDEHAPPPGAIVEGEVCDEGVIIDNHNGGCWSKSGESFTDVACGDTVIGESWKDGNRRDQDWFRIPASDVDRIVEMEFHAEFHALAGAFMFMDCPGEHPAMMIAEPCTPETVRGYGAVPAGFEPWFIIVPHDVDGLPCGEMNTYNDYIVTFTCDEAGCPELGDLDEDDFVAMSDLLTLLANYGDGNAEGDVDGDGDTGFSDLVILLANFGPCP